LFNFRDIIATLFSKEEFIINFLGLAIIRDCAHPENKKAEKISAKNNKIKCFNLFNLILIYY